MTHLLAWQWLSVVGGWREEPLHVFSSTGLTCLHHTQLGARLILLELMLKILGLVRVEILSASYRSD